MTKVDFINYLIVAVIIFKNILVYAIIARIILSWFTFGQYGSRGRVSQFLRDVTEPVISLARKLPHQIGMFDLAPLIALFGLDLLGQLFVYMLSNLI